MFEVIIFLVGIYVGNAISPWISDWHEDWQTRRDGQQ